MAGYVYLIGSPTFQWYKIGKSVAPQIRIQNLGILLPFKIVVVGVWKAVDHTAMETAMHELHATNQINGEWFKFSKKEVVAILNSIPEAARIFPSVSHNTMLVNFSNIERDCAEDETIRFKVKKMRGNFTPEERRIKKLEAIQKKRNAKVLTCTSN